MPLRASFDTCIQGEWVFDAKSSDSPKRVLKKLKRQLKREYDRRYYRQKPVEQEGQVSLPDNLPAFVFSEEALTIKQQNQTWLFNTNSLKRVIPTEQALQSYSLASYSQSTYTYLASVDKSQLTVDSTTGLGLSVQEVYQLLDTKQLKVDVSLSLAGEKPLSLQRFFHRKIQKHCD